MMKKQIRSRVALAFALSLVFTAACESKQQPPAASPAPKSDAVENKAAPVEFPPTEIVIYTSHTSDEELFNLRYGNMLRAKYPKHTIKFLNGSTGGSVAKMMTDKTKFDIYWATSGTYETSAFTYDFAYDMTPLIQKNNVDLNKFDSAFKEVVSGAAFGGRTYFFPVHADVQVTYYNKDLFEKFGVAFPSGNLTWDDFYKLAERMTRYESGVQYTGFA
ncbi:MAG: extracellular solute-binding protein family 1, partial [Paenibacillus sp.]|nr:extracellular solute-binding protein family 1 [Paenibacillus sp.]